MSEQPCVLVVDDEVPLAGVIASYLEREGLRVSTAHTGPAAVEAIRELSPDLVILDVMLPGFDGIEVCRQLRTFTDCYVIMLTARDEEIDKVVGLSMGADDYVVKPFNPVELIARIRARLREPQQVNGESLRIGDLDIDVVAHEVRRGSQPISLTPLEFDLLVILARKPQQVFTREVLLEKVWGYHYKADTRLVNVHVQRLRAKIEQDPDHPTIVTTVRGVGYRAGGTGD